MQKRYWLIGGIIFALISFTIAFLINHDPSFMDNSNSYTGILSVLYFPAISFVVFVVGDTPISIYIIFVMYGFLVGALFGRLYAKIKGEIKINIQ